MTELLSYREIWSGFLAIDEILLYLHYCMWLEIEYPDEPENHQLEILRGPRQEFEAEITEHLKEHYEDYVHKRVICTRCNNELFWKADLTKCAKQVYQAGTQPPRWVECGAPFKIVRSDPGEQFVREKAELALMGSNSRIGQRSLVGARIADRINPGIWWPRDVDLRLPLLELRQHLRGEITDQVDGLNAKLTVRDPARFLGRRDLYPRGETIAAKHADYLETRDKLISCYHWLDGQTANHPEFVDRDEQARAIRVFKPPVFLINSETPSRETPLWDTEQRELRFHSKVCKAYRKTTAPNQISILEAFNKAGWPTRISSLRDIDGDPLVDRRLGETIRGLKNRLKYVKFRGDGTGHGVIWEPASKIKPKKA